MQHTPWALQSEDSLSLGQGMFNYFSNNFSLFLFSILGHLIESLPYFFLSLLFRDNFFSSLKVHYWLIYCSVSRIKFSIDRFLSDSLFSAPFLCPPFSLTPSLGFLWEDPPPLHCSLTLPILGAAAISALFLPSNCLPWPSSFQNVFMRLFLCGFLYFH